MDKSNIKKSGLHVQIIIALIMFVTLIGGVIAVNAGVTNDVETLKEDVIDLENQQVKSEERQDEVEQNVVKIATHYEDILRRLDSIENKIDALKQ